MLNRPKPNKLSYVKQSMRNYLKVWLISPCAICFSTTLSNSQTQRMKRENAACNQWRGQVSSQGRKRMEESWTRVSVMLAWGSLCSKKVLTQLKLLISSKKKEQQTTQLETKLNILSCRLLILIRRTNSWFGTNTFHLTTSSNSKTSLPRQLPSTTTVTRCSAVTLETCGSKRSSLSKTISIATTLTSSSLSWALPSSADSRIWIEWKISCSNTKVQRKVSSVVCLLKRSTNLS